MAEELGVLVGILTVGVGASSDSFVSCLLWGPFSSYWVALSSLDVMVCAWSYWTSYALLWEASSFRRGDIYGWIWEMVGGL